MREERDEMGTVSVPEEALYGAQTQRAVENFPISGRRFQREFIQALGLIKKAAAQSNEELGVLDPAYAEAIRQAAHEVAEGRYDSQFVVDVFQTGSGTSTNMNANEVIAHVASQASGLKIHANDHVNRSQSSNDVIPTAIHVAAATAVQGRLLPATNILRLSLHAKAEEYRNVLKIGRTHLQDAVPLYFGDELGAYARQVELAGERISGARDGLMELALGGTAVGTGLNAPEGFARRVIGLLGEWTGLPFEEAKNHFEAQAARDAVAFLSGALRGYAIGLTKIGNDLRLLSCGPRCGIGEVRLPAVQPGSSIMPGKVNPVIIESVLMVCAAVIGHDAAITWCCAGGQLELNAMMPLMAYAALDSIGLLAAASENFAGQCIRELGADTRRMGAMVEESYALAAALTPALGHEKAAGLARKAAERGKTIREIALEEGAVGPDVLAAALDPVALAGKRSGRE